MEQRDYLKAQIEQLGQALGRIVAEFLGSKSHGDVEQAVAITNESLKSELDLDVDLLVGRTTPDLLVYLTQRKLTGEPLAPLTDYLIALAEHTMPTNPARAVALYRSVVQLYEVMDTTTNLYSLDRFEKEKKIKAILEQKR